MTICAVTVGVAVTSFSGGGYQPAGGSATPTDNDKNWLLLSSCGACGYLMATPSLQLKWVGN